MKLTVLFFLLCTTLSYVYSFHFLHKKGHAQVSSSYQQPQSSRVPAEIYVELPQQEPRYTAPLAVESAPSLDIFSILKNKFSRITPNLNFVQEPAVVAAPLQQGTKQPQYICYPNPDYQVPVTSYVQEPQPYQPIPIRPTHTQIYEIQSPQYAHQQIQPQVYSLPLQSQSGGKFNIFSKIKSHFSGKKSSNDPKFAIVAKVGKPVETNPLNDIVPISQQLEEPTTKPF